MPEGKKDELKRITIESLNMMFETNVSMLCSFKNIAVNFIIRLGRQEAEILSMRMEYDDELALLRAEFDMLKDQLLSQVKNGGG